MVELHFGATTDVGAVREVNQDAYLAAPPVFVVADGMGGHEGGEIASAIVVQEFQRLVDDGYDSRKGVDAVAGVLTSCQRLIMEYGAHQRANGHPDWYAGTTVVAAVLVEDDEGPKWLLANLGDSRIYKLHEGELDQISVDHSVVQELVDAGAITVDDAATHPERHVITRALGGPGHVEADFFLLPLSSAARLVLCSDGVSGMIGDAEMAGILRVEEDPRDAADQIVAAAVAAGGADNATAVVVDVVGLSENIDSYDAERQRMSLHEKLGALP